MRSVLLRILPCLGLLALACGLLPARFGSNAFAAGNGRAANSAISTYAQTILGDSPAAYWQLNETSGATFTDATGNGYNGVLTSAVTLGAPGPLISDPSDTSVLLGSSTHNHITVSNVGSLNTSNGVTLEAWINPIASSGNGPNVVSINAASNLAFGSYVLTVASSGSRVGVVSLRTGLAGTNQTLILASANGAAPPGQWSHLVGTYDGTTLVLYVDGVEVNRIATSAGLGAVLGNIVLGGLALQGDLGEVAVYGQALTASQVLAHYNAALGAPPITSTPTRTASATATPTATASATPTSTSTPTATNTAPTYVQAVLGDSPQAYWRLDETTGTTFDDLTGNGHSGSLNSSVTLGAPGALVSDPTNTSVLLGNATDFHIIVTNTAGIDTSRGVTLEAWVKPVSAPGAAPNVVSINPTTNTGSYVLTVTTSGPSTGMVTFRTGNTGPGPGTIIATSPVGAATNGQWSYLVGTYNGVDLALYVNGVLVTSHAASAGLGEELVNAVLGGAALQGNLDEVAVYGHALTPSQVLAHYNAALGAPPTSGTPTPAAITTDGLLTAGAR